MSTSKRADAPKLAPEIEQALRDDPEMKEIHVLDITPEDIDDAVQAGIFRTEDIPSFVNDGLRIKMRVFRTGGLLAPLSNFLARKKSREQLRHYRKSLGDRNEQRQETARSDYDQYRAVAAEIIQERPELKRKGKAHQLASSVQKRLKRHGLLVPSIWTIRRALAAPK
jgi:hypothetical protein